LQASFPLLAPAQGYLTEDFDPARRHFGLDFAGRTGNPIHAPADGYVIFAGWTFDGGNMMMLSHGSGYLTVYKHTQSLLKSEHAYVRRGDVIALVGSTGNTSSGPHLHFELWRDGVPLDPKEFLLTTPRVQQERASRGG
jgi:murein DD-endopeptidase MepM/ murein hydrolase activator NlpD